MDHTENLSGWGNNINIDSNIHLPRDSEDIVNLYKNNIILNSIARGLGRSYGDSSLDHNVISLKNYEKFNKLDDNLGTLECSANYSLNEILKLIVNKGWFFNVTPGSKFVTIIWMEVFVIMFFHLKLLHLRAFYIIVVKKKIQNFFMLLVGEWG